MVYVLSCAVCAMVAMRDESSWKRVKDLYEQEVAVAADIIE
jgi:hypothetical protein